MFFLGAPSTETSQTYPSFFRICAMLSLSFECGISTVGSSARWALRIRVNMSEIGSVIKLPTGFGDARNQAIQRRFAKRQARAGELAQITMAPATDRAAVDHARRTGIAWQLRERGIVLLRLQFSANGGVFLHRLGFLLV